eukprot:363239-Chlamydomonas_euryale.AAC.2
MYPPIEPESQSHNVRVRVIGIGPTRDVPVLSAARRRVSNSGAGRCHKGNATACSPESPLPTPRRQRGRENWAQTCNNPTPPRGARPADHSTQLR